MISAMVVMMKKITKTTSYNHPRKIVKTKGKINGIAVVGSADISVDDPKNFKKYTSIFLIMKPPINDKRIIDIPSGIDTYAIIGIIRRANVTMHQRTIFRPPTSRLWMYINLSPDIANADGPIGSAIMRTLHDDSKKKSENMLNGKSLYTRKSFTQLAWSISNSLCIAHRGRHWRINRIQGVLDCCTSWRCWRSQLNIAGVPRYLSRRNGR